MFLDAWQPNFPNSDLCVATPRYVYQVAVLTVLLCGAEAWAVKARHRRPLESFHRQCVRSILGIPRLQQWEGRLATQELATRLGMRDSIGDCLSRHHLRWLGHLSRMDDDRLPKQILFVEGIASRPRHGPKKRWRYSVMRESAVAWS